MLNKKHRIIIGVEILAAMAIMVTLFFTNNVTINPANQPQNQQNYLSARTEVTVRLLETSTIQYVDKPVTEVKYLERIVRVPVELRNFNNLQDLEQWLQNKKEATTFYLQSQDTNIDCDDYAQELQNKALADGYILSFEIIEYREYNALFINPLPVSQSLHAINLAIIRNNIYYIEPQTGEIVFASFLD